jgi:hypothetical protein
MRVPPIYIRKEKRSGGAPEEFENNFAFCSEIRTFAANFKVDRFELLATTVKNAKIYSVR